MPSPPPATSPSTTDTAKAEAAAVVTAKVPYMTAAERAFRWRWAIGLLLASLALSFLAASYDRFPGDEPLLRLASGVGPAYDPIADAFNKFSVVAFFAVVLLSVPAVLLARGRSFEPLAVLLTVALMRPVIDLVKIAVGRPRPTGDFPIRDLVHDASFPSGHVATAALAFGFWFVFAPKLLPQRAALPVRLLCLTGVMLMAVSRMWSGVHWPSDVLGSLLWVATFFAVALALEAEAGNLLRRVARQPAWEPPAEARPTIEPSTIGTGRATPDHASHRDEPSS